MKLSRHYTATGNELPVNLACSTCRGNMISEEDLVGDPLITYQIVTLVEFECGTVQIMDWYTTGDNRIIKIVRTKTLAVCPRS